MTERSPRDAGVNDVASLFSAWNLLYDGDLFINASEDIEALEGFLGMQGYWPKV